MAPEWQPDALRLDLDLPGVVGLECSAYPCVLFVRADDFANLTPRVRSIRADLQFAVTFQGQAECVDAMVPLHPGGLSDVQQTLLNERMQGIQARRR